MTISIKSGQYYGNYPNVGLGQGAQLGAPLYPADGQLLPGAPRPSLVPGTPMSGRLLDKRQGGLQYQGPSGAGPGNLFSVYDSRDDPNPGNPGCGECGDGDVNVDYATSFKRRSKKMVSFSLVRDDDGFNSTNSTRDGGDFLGLNTIAGDAGKLLIGGFGALLIIGGIALVALESDSAKKAAGAGLRVL